MQFPATPNTHAHWSPRKYPPAPSTHYSKHQDHHRKSDHLLDRSWIMDAARLARYGIPAYRISSTQGRCAVGRVNIERGGGVVWLAGWGGMKKFRDAKKWGDGA